MLQKILNRLGPTTTAPQASGSVPVQKAPLPSAERLLDDLFTRLKGFDFNPEHAIDIGANKGRWTRSALEHFPDAHFSMVEPQPAMAEFLQPMVDQNSNIHFHPVGAGSADGSLPFTLSDRDDSCSFLPTEDLAKERGHQRIDVPIRTLDSILQDSTLPAPTLIKIDAEGLDLEVLKGAPKTLASAEILLVEAAVANPRFPNDLGTVLTTASKLGYRPLDLTDLNRPHPHGLLWLVEIALVREASPLGQRISQVCTGPAPKA